MYLPQGLLQGGSEALGGTPGPGERGLVAPGSHRPGLVGGRRACRDEKSSHVQESFHLHATIYISKTIYTPGLR